MPDRQPRPGFRRHATPESTDRALAERPCRFVPAHEPWMCATHRGGLRTRLDQAQCNIARPPVGDAPARRILERLVFWGSNPDLPDWPIPPITPEGFDTLRSIIAEARAALAAPGPGLLANKTLLAMCLGNFTRHEWDALPAEARGAWLENATDAQRAVGMYVRRAAAEPGDEPGDWESYKDAFPAGKNIRES